MTVKLSSKLPDAGSPENGLDQYQILQHPKQAVTVVAILHLETFETKAQTGTQTNPLLVIDAIEPIDGNDTLVVQEIMQAKIRDRIDPEKPRTGSLFEDDINEVMARSGRDRGPNATD